MDLYVANDEDPNRLYMNVLWPGGAKADPKGLGFRLVDRAKQEGVADGNGMLYVVMQDPQGSVTAADFIEACHAHGIKIVAWYLPGFRDLAKDYKRSAEAIEYRTPCGQKIDSFALDIEASTGRTATPRTRPRKTPPARVR